MQYIDEGIYLNSKVKFTTYENKQMIEKVGCVIGFKEITDNVTILYAVIKDDKGKIYQRHIREITHLINEFKELKLNLNP